ncbi:IclR family transcriptional regulator [Gulosibacter macacae]|uniref:IclR family transcriptional regulator n=1 Tax=Gulosibacter macacae TaxID=2488791 RepID=A0A3P3W1P7_9MICO|nr:helix-turn-helix domain-containing protein [Gulosibacter macacae]RRJ88278.1 IclR family transcriptional regulator [Gulosibacter macacae]
MTEPTDQTPVSGVLPRIHVLLTRISASGRHGIRLKDLAEETGIARPTVHRMLQDLSAVGYVSQLENKHYVLGEELFWLGLAAPFTFPAMPALRVLADSLALTTGDTVYVSMRVPGGVRYLLRAEGDYPLQSKVVTPGDFKPFTSSYTGLAMLGTMPPDLQESAIEHLQLTGIVAEIDRPTLRDELRAAVASVGTQGWLTGANLVMPGLSGIGAPVPVASGLPIAAVSISAAEMRITPERAAKLAPELLNTARRMGHAISQVRR